MAKRFRTLFLAFAVAISACGSVRGDAPGRAGIQSGTPYDATHLDAGNVDDGDAMAGHATNDGDPQLVP